MSESAPEQPAPSSAAEIVPNPSSPEEARNREAAATYMRYIATALEPWLEGPDYYQQTPPRGRHGVTGIVYMTGTFNERTLRVHTPPDNRGRSREIVYQTTIGEGRGYEVDQNAAVFVQEGSVHYGAMEASPPHLPSADDLRVLDMAFENLVPWKDVQNRVRGEVQALLTPAPQEGYGQA